MQLKTFLISAVAAVFLLFICVVIAIFVIQKPEMEPLPEEEVSSVEEEVPKPSKEFTHSGIELISEEEREFVKDKLPRFTSDLEQARGVNEDVIAWLNIPNTNISYPLPINTSRFIQGTNTLDYEFYLTRALDLKQAPAYDESAVVYIDSRNNLQSSTSLDKNTIVYGHNWTNIESGGNKLKVADPKDKQFAQLPSFADLEFAKGTQYFTIDLEDEQLVFMVFAAMYVDTYNADHRNGYYYIETNPSNEEFLAVIEEARNRSEHLYKVPVGPDDHIVTLSTCTLKFGSNHNQRFVVMGRLLHEDEDIVDFPEPVKNPMPKRPNV